MLKIFDVSNIKDFEKMNNPKDDDDDDDDDDNDDDDDDDDDYNDDDDDVSADMHSNKCHEQWSTCTRCWKKRGQSSETCFW